MPVNFQNKVVIVTGAGGGIGRGIAEAFHRQGAFVWFTDIDDESVRAAASEAGDRAFSAVLNVADEQ